MPKTVQVLLVIVVVAFLWAVLASVDAGPAGLGAVLCTLSLLHVLTGEFTGSNKLVWLLVSLAGLLFAAAAIGSDMLLPPESTGRHPLYAMGTAVALILGAAYFVVGRRQRNPGAE